MKGKVGERADLISDLPLIILHHILLFLPSEDSVRTSVLSKKWNSIQKSFPFLEFQLPACLRNVHTETPQLNEQRGECLNFVDRSLQYFVRNKLFIETLDLDLSYIHENSIPLVNTWLPLALHSGVYCLSFNVGVELGDVDGERDRHYPLPGTTFTVNSSFLCHSSKFFRLEKLTLSMVPISEKIVYDIIRNCPNLNDLNLLSIQGLKSLNISKPDKLVRLRVKIHEFCDAIENAFVDALSLKCLELDFCAPKFDLTSCCNLRELKLSHSYSTDDVFHHNISCLLLLEVLEISSSYSLRRIRISLPRLKHLFLKNCQAMERIEIDAPNLSIILLKPEISHHSTELPVLVPGDVSHWSMFFDFNMQWMSGGDFDSFWFLKLGNILAFLPKI